MDSNNDWQDDPAQAAIIICGWAWHRPTHWNRASRRRYRRAPTQRYWLEWTAAPDLDWWKCTITLPPDRHLHRREHPEQRATPGPTGTPGATATPGATPTPTPGGGGTCTEAFDGVTAPALPAGWMATNPDPGDGVLWTTVTAPDDTAPNSAFIPDQDRNQRQGARQPSDHGQLGCGAS